MSVLIVTGLLVSILSATLASSSSRGAAPRVEDLQPKSDREMLEELLAKYAILEETTRAMKSRNERLEQVVSAQAMRLDQQQERIRRLEDAVLTTQSPDETQTSTGSLTEPEARKPPEDSEKTVAGKRADDIGALEPLFAQINQQLTQMAAQIEVFKNQNAALVARDQAIESRIGASYIRWGHTACPDSSELLYTGIVAGTQYNAAGGGGNYLCLHPNPTFDSHRQPSNNGVSLIYGSEYDICDEPECNTTPACAVCRISRSATVMIPGTNACSAGWTREYSGYLMADREVYSASSEYICVDANHSYVHTEQRDDDQNLLFYTVFKCGALTCPPYAEGKLATCVVCSK